MKNLSLFIFIIFLSNPLFAMYKCRDASTTLYSNLPCKNGVMIDTKDHITASANASAQERNKSEKTELKQLMQQQEKERTQQTQFHHNRTSKIETHKKHCAKLTLRVKWAEENLSHARGAKNQEKLTRTLNRAKENYALTCTSNSNTSFNKF